MQQKRLYVSGCGGHAIQSHIATAPQAGFELVGLFDTKAESIAAALAAWRKAAGEGPKIQIFNSHEAMLASGVGDALVITSPDEYHADQLLAAVNYKVPTLIDKPLAIDDQQMEIVREALARAGQTGVPLTSCHPRRFDPPYMWIQSNLRRLSDQYGELLHVEMDFSYHAPVAEWKHARSLLLDHYPHEVDFLRFLLGDMPTEVWKLHDEYNLYSVVGKAGGVTFTCMGTRRLERRAFPEEIRLRFDKGSCSVNTETGVATLASHEYNSTTLEVAGKTDYNLRFNGVMQDFRRMVDGQGSTLTLTDLEVNTASAIALAERGYYATH